MAFIDSACFELCLCVCVLACSRFGFVAFRDRAVASHGQDPKKCHKNYKRTSNDKNRHILLANQPIIELRQPCMCVRECVLAINRHFKNFTSNSRSDSHLSLYGCLCRIDPNPLGANFSIIQLLRRSLPSLRCDTFERNTLNRNRVASLVYSFINFN